MTGAEASVAALLGAPAGAFANMLAGGVHTKTADGHENMGTRLHPDGDEAAFTCFAIAGKLLAGQAAVQQSCLHEDIGGAAAAVIGAVFDVAMTGAKDIRLVLEGVRGIHGELKSLGGGLADTGKTAVETNLRIATHHRAGSGGALRSGTLGGSLLLGAIVGPSLGVGLLGTLLSVVVGPSLSVGLLLSVGSLRLGSSIVTGGIVTVLGLCRGAGKEAGGKSEADDRFHGCVIGSEF